MTMVFRRNKWCPGYNLNIDISYQGVGGTEGAEGVLKFTEFQDDGDFEFTIEHEGDKFKDECTNSIA